MTKIKICGIKRIEDIQIVNDTKLDYIGYVFAKSKRQVTVDLVHELNKVLHQSIQRVGVFVDESPEVVIEIVNSGVIDLIQLHGNESNNYIQFLQNHTDKKIIKAIPIKNALDVEQIKESKADFLLFDSFTPGSGKTFDWSYLEEIDRPFFLAGGLNVENVEKALEDVKPYCVDVSSGVEVDEFKDKNKVINFINKVRYFQIQKGKYEKR